MEPRIRTFPLTHEWAEFWGAIASMEAIPARWYDAAAFHPILASITASFQFTQVCAAASKPWCCIYMGLFPPSHQPKLGLLQWNLVLLQCSGMLHSIDAFSPHPTKTGVAENTCCAAPKNRCVCNGSLSLSASAPKGCSKSTFMSRFGVIHTSLNFSTYTIIYSNSPQIVKCTTLKLTAIGF